MTIHDKLVFRMRYVKLSFFMLSFMVASLLFMALYGITPETITAVSAGFIGLAVSFAGIIASHFGTTPKDD